MKAAHLRACFAFALVAAAAPAATQQRLFALDSAGTIWRVDGHTTAKDTLVQIANARAPVGHEVRDLVFDPTTERFYVLAADAAGGVVLRVDPAAGTTTAVCSFNGVDVDGLHRRSDGVLVAERRSVTFR